jgi:hypothetical protein
MRKAFDARMARLAGSMSGIPCFVIGNAPSLLDINTKLVEPFFTIGINRAYRALKLSMLMWQDPELMLDSRRDIEKLDCFCVCTQDADPGKKFHHFKIRGKAFHKSSSPDTLYGHGSTGPLAVQMAHAMGCRPIFLLGMDCTCRGKQTDFYGVNRDWKNHTIQLCKNGLHWISTNFTHSEVVNLSSSPQEVIDQTMRMKKFAQGRNHYLSMIRRRSLTL